MAGQARALGGLTACALALCSGCGSAPRQELFGDPVVIDVATLPATPDESSEAASDVAPTSAGDSNDAAELGPPAPGVEPSVASSGGSAPVGASAGAGDDGGDPPAGSGSEPSAMAEALAANLDEPLPCPEAASFCDGFELEPVPGDAAYVSQRGDFVEGESLLLDAGERYSGDSALLVPAADLGFDYRMLSVGLPEGAFWARLFVRTDVAFGDVNGDVLMSASVLEQGFNGDRALEVSERFGFVVLEKNGRLFGPEGQNPNGSQTGAVVSADTWHCLEAFVDGASGDVQLYLDGELAIDAPGWAPDEYVSFRFGYQRFNTRRNVWMDDVAVGSERLGCN